MEILSLQHVGMTYYTKTAETQALRDLSFSVQQKEFVAVLGPSGCGKTTVLSLISGLLRPTEGEILLNGKPLNGPSASVGYMLQHDHLFPWRNIWQNVTLGLEIQKKRTPEHLAYAEQLLNKYGLGDFRTRYPSQLSGGMRQRAALIRTLTLQPDLLLLDEPFSALDFQTRLQVCDDVYSIIRSEHKTAVLVTHDISEAISMADRIVLLSSRPATVKNVHPVRLSGDTPLSRREAAGFSALFECIWRDLNEEG